MKNINLIKKTFDQFFVENPFFIFAVFFLLALTLKFTTLLLALFSKSFKMKITLITIVIFGICYKHWYYPNMPTQNSKASGIFKLNSIKKSKFGFIYSGRFEQLHLEDQKIYKNIPCTIFLKKKLKTNYTYKFNGTFLIKQKSFFFKVTHSSYHKKTYNLVNIRYNIKKKLSKIIKKNISKESAHFLSALVTGELNDSFLKFSFQRTGLSHIMAISGFHFGLLASFFLLILKKTKKFKLIITIAVINIYFLYMGCSASVLRAYVTIGLTLIAELINRKNYSLNSLAIALFIELLLDPLYYLNLGFILSFLSVLGILLVYPNISLIFCKFLKKRSLKDIAHLNIPSKIAAFLVNFIREAITLNIAISIVLFPVLLFFFHKITVFTFIYNMFFPPLILISILLLIPSCFCSYIAHVNTTYTSFILKLITSPPAPLEYIFRTKNISTLFIVNYLIIIFSLAIFFKYYKKINTSPICYFF